MDRSSPHQGDSAEAQEERKDDGNARLIAAALRRHAEQQHHQEQQHRADGLFAVGDPRVMGTIQRHSTFSEVQGQSVPASVQNVLRMLPRDTSSPYSTAISPNTSADTLYRLQLQSQMLASNTEALPFSRTSASPSGHPTIEALIERIHAETTGRAAAMSYPGTLGLSADQVFMLLGQQASPVGMTQQQLPYGGNDGTLASPWGLNAGQRHVSALFMPNAAGFPAGRSIATQLDQRSRLLVAASILGKMDAQTAAHSTSALSPDQTMRIREQAYELQCSKKTLEPTKESVEEKSTGSGVRRKRDRSEDETGSGGASLSHETPTKRKKRPYHHESFPVKLHRLLRETERAGKTDIISFSDDGKEFCVHKPALLESEILPQYFRHNSLNSLRRLLNMYGFVRLQDGAEGGTFRHPSFLKERPDLCKDLDRVR